LTRFLLTTVPSDSGDLLFLPPGTRQRQRQQAHSEGEEKRVSGGAGRGARQRDRLRAPGECSQQRFQDEEHLHQRHQGPVAGNHHDLDQRIQQLRAAPQSEPEKGPALAGFGQIDASDAASAAVVGQEVDQAARGAEAGNHAEDVGRKLHPPNALAGKSRCKSIFIALSPASAHGPGWLGIATNSGG
jgi:hypothetical protein